MNTKLEEYLLDFVENELSANEAEGVAREVAASATLRAEVAALEAVRAEIKNTQDHRIIENTDLSRLHDRIMLQIENATRDIP